MTPPIRLVLVDDHVIVREGLRHVLEDAADFVETRIEEGKRKLSHAVGQ